jgi:hypothetical protein
LTLFTFQSQHILFQSKKFQSVLKVYAIGAQMSLSHWCLQGDALVRLTLMLDGAEIVRLLMCGCKSLNAQLLQQTTHLFVRLYRFSTFPQHLYHLFPKLQSLAVGMRDGEEAYPIIDAPNSFLPHRQHFGIDYLRFDLHQVIYSLQKAISDMNHDDCAASLEKCFPNLTRLEVVCPKFVYGRFYITELVHALPSGLKHLSLLGKGVAPFNFYDIGALPRTLETFYAECVSIDDMDKVKWPPTLTHLHIKKFTCSYHSRPSFPASLTTLKIKNRCAMSKDKIHMTLDLNTLPLLQNLSIKTTVDCPMIIIVTPSMLLHPKNKVLKLVVGVIDMQLMDHQLQQDELLCQCDVLFTGAPLELVESKMVSYLGHDSPSLFLDHMVFPETIIKLDLGNIVGYSTLATFLLPPHLKILSLSTYTCLIISPECGLPKTLVDLTFRIFDKSHVDALPSSLTALTILENDQYLFPTVNQKLLALKKLDVPLLMEGQWHLEAPLLEKLVIHHDKCYESEPPRLLETMVLQTPNLRHLALISEGNVEADMLKRFVSMCRTNLSIKQPDSTWHEWSLCLSKLSQLETLKIDAPWLENPQSTGHDSESLSCHLLPRTLRHFMRPCPQNLNKLPENVFATLPPSLLSLHLTSTTPSEYHVSSKQFAHFPSSLTSLHLPKYITQDKNDGDILGQLLLTSPSIIDFGDPSRYICSPESIRAYFLSPIWCGWKSKDFAQFEKICDIQLAQRGEMTDNVKARLNDKDIAIVMNQLKLSRNGAIAALIEHEYNVDGTIVAMVE